MRLLYLLSRSVGPLKPGLCMIRGRLTEDNATATLRSATTQELGCFADNARMVTLD